MTEKGIALDRGHRDLSRVMVAQPVLEEVIPKGAQTPQEPHSPTEHPNVGTINSVQYARQARQSVISRPYNANKQMTEKGQRLLCYLCGEPNHFQRNCPRQYCQSCGRQGHHRRDCRTKRQIMCLDTDAVSNVGGWTEQSEL